MIYNTRLNKAGHKLASYSICQDHFSYKPLKRQILNKYVLVTMHVYSHDNHKHETLVIGMSLNLDISTNTSS